jgi:hypothetical protein
MWILLGCGGLILLIIVLLVALVGFGWYKAKQAGLDPELIRKNPAVAMVKMAIAANPDAELVSIDEGRGIVTVRDKKTGKTVTLNFEDVKRGRISFEGEGGERAAIGGAVSLPAWFPSYPGVTPQSTYAVSDATSESAGFQFTTRDSPAQVLEFYESGLKKSGLTVSTLKQDQGGMITARDDAEQREATVTVTAGDSGANVIGTFKSKK